MDSVAGRAAALELSQLIRGHKGAIIERWSRIVCDRIGLDVESDRQLVDDLPEFLEQISEDLAAADPSSSSRCREVAAAHGRQRVKLGIDIGELVEELGVVVEAILEEARLRGVPTAPADVSRMIRLVAEGTAESVRTYAQLRDEQLAEENSRHFSFVAHELRTPIQTARLTAHLLGENRDSPELLERLHRAVDQLAEHIDNALTEIKIKDRSARKMAVHASNDLLEEAVENARLQARRKNVELAHGGERLEVLADRRVLVSALTNLVVNAVKFTPAGGRVTVRSGRGEGRRVRFEIDDECGGLSEEAARRLFHPFAQAGADRSGFGLGLVIAQEAIAVHQGTIWAEDRAPRGCRFVIEIPGPGEPERPASNATRFAARG